MSFKTMAIDARLKDALAKLNISTPTEIQAQAIPPALEGKDLVGTARTGTGKTFAFALPLITRLLSTEPRVKGKSRALILAPTRELAQQIMDALKTLCHGLPLKLAVIYGGVAYGGQQQALRGGADIVVACPGRLLDHLNNKVADLRFVDVLILDEADQMFDMGFLPNVRRIISSIPKERQTLLFSATFAAELRSLIKEICVDPVRIDVASNEAAHTVTHALYPVSAHLKADLLLKIVETESEGSILIFTRTKHRANRIAEKLEKAGNSVGILHGNKSQSQRQKALTAFRKGSLRMLVATDIAARGIDVAHVTHVINFDIPETPTAYIHRIGRTGRAEKEGDAYTLVSPEDGQLLRDIERTLGKPIDRKTMEGFDYKAASAPRAEGAKPDALSRTRQDEHRDRAARGGSRSRFGGSSSGSSRGSSRSSSSGRSSGYSSDRPSRPSSSSRPSEASASDRPVRSDRDRPSTGWPDRASSSKPASSSGTAWPARSASPWQGSSASSAGASRRPSSGSSDRRPSSGSSDRRPSSSSNDRRPSSGGSAGPRREGGSSSGSRGPRKSGPSGGGSSRGRFGR